MNSHKQTGLRSLLVASSPPSPRRVEVGRIVRLRCPARRRRRRRSLAPIELATGGFTPYCCPRRLPPAKLQSEKKNKPSGSRHTRHFTPIFLGALPPPTPRARERERERESERRIFKLSRSETLGSPRAIPSSLSPICPAAAAARRRTRATFPTASPADHRPPKLPPTRASHRLPGPFAQPALNIGSSHGRRIPETIRLVAQDLLVSSGRGRQCGGRPREFLRGSLPARVASRPSSPHRENRS